MITLVTMAKMSLHSVWEKEMANCFKKTTAVDEMT